MAKKLTTIEQLSSVIDQFDQEIMSKEKNKIIPEEDVKDLGNIVVDFLGDTEKIRNQKLRNKILKLKTKLGEFRKRNDVLEKRCITMGQEKKVLRRKLEVSQKDLNALQNEYDRFDILYFEEKE